MMDAATVVEIVFAGILALHPAWDVQEECQGIYDEDERELCEVSLGEGPGWAMDVAESFGRAWEVRPESDPLLMLCVVEKESSMFDLGGGRVGSSQTVCLRTFRNERVLTLDELDDPGYCTHRALWLYGTSDQTSRRNVRILRSTDTTMTFDTCCARERGMFQLLPNDFRSGRRVVLSVDDPCLGYGDDEALCDGEAFILPRSERERFDFVDRLDWNTAIGFDEVLEHIAICDLDEGDHPMLGIAAYNVGHCEPNERFKTYYNGVRWRYVKMCEARTSDGTPVSELWEGCENIPPYRAFD